MMAFENIINANNWRYGGAVILNLRCSIPSEVFAYRSVAISRNVK